MKTETEQQRAERFAAYEEYESGLLEKRKNDPSFKRKVNLAARMCVAYMNKDNRDRRLKDAAEALCTLIGPMSYADRAEWCGLTVGDIVVAYGIQDEAGATNYEDPDEWPHLSALKRDGVSIPDMITPHWTKRASPFEDEEVVE